MTLFRGFAALLLLALAACMTTQPPPKGPSFYVIRHLQKAEGQDPPLSDEGRANARRLIGFLAAEPPRVVYVSTTRRAFETAAPAAKKLRAKVRRYDPADTPGLIARVLAERGPVLIVGHSNTVPDIVRQLGGVELRPMREDEFGQV